MPDPVRDLAQALTLAAGLLRESSGVAVTCHTDPDGDALGSLLGLVRGLRSVGVEAYGVLPDGSAAMPRRYDFLPSDGLLRPLDTDTDTDTDAGADTGFDTVVAVDASSPARLGRAGRLLHDAAPGQVIVLDHHAHGEPYGDVRVVDPRAPATTALVVHLLDILGAPLDEPTATCLYVGLVTDTGSFRHSSTSADTHRMAARLLESGVRPGAVSETLYASLPHAAVRLTGRILARSVLEPAVGDAPGLVWSSVGAEEIEESGVASADLDGVIDKLRVAEEAEVALFLRQDAGGLWQVSLRSRGAVDVGDVCAGFGGGGHPRAAGFTSSESMVKTVGMVRRRLAGGPRARRAN